MTPGAARPVHDRPRGRPQGRPWLRAPLATAAALAVLLGGLTTLAACSDTPVMGVVTATVTATVTTTVTVTAEPPADPAAIIADALSVHVGERASHLESVFGRPVAERRLDGGLGWMQRTYASGGVAAVAVVDGHGRIRLYGVLVCTPHANATMWTADDAEVVLQGPPIARAEVAEADGAAPGTVRLHYPDTRGGGSLGQLLELPPAPAASEAPPSGSVRAHLLGINRACGPDSSPPLEASAGFVGDAADAPDELRAYRDAHPADFVTEIQGAYELTDWGGIDLVTDDGLAVGAYASPSWEDLPPGFAG